jgi:hypothetical protein
MEDLCLAEEVYDNPVAAREKEAGEVVAVEEDSALVRAEIVYARIAVQHCLISRDSLVMRYPAQNAVLK